MSRFSKAEAEARGWVFVHEQDEFTVLTSETQGETRFTPATLRAEKYVSLPGRGQQLVNQEAESMGLLLERIAAYEAFLDSVVDQAVVPAPLNEALDPVNTAGLPQRTVIGPGGLELTEQEWAARDRTDSIYKDDRMIHYGPHADAVAADEARQELSADAENERAAEPDVGPTEHLFIDNSNSIDSPGQSAPSSLIVRKGEESFEDVSARKDAEEARLEDERVLAAQEAAIARKEAEESAPAPADEPSASEIRAEAEEEKAKEIREGDEPEDAKAVLAAGAEADQAAHDEAGEDEPEATPAAKAKAEELGVDLSEVEGSGKDGRITAPDVETHAADSES